MVHSDYKWKYTQNKKTRDCQNRIPQRSRMKICKEWTYDNRRGSSAARENFVERLHRGSMSAEVSSITDVRRRNRIHAIELKASQHDIDQATTATSDTNRP